MSSFVYSNFLYGSASSALPVTLKDIAGARLVQLNVMVTECVVGRKTYPIISHNNFVNRWPDPRIGSLLPCFDGVQRMSNQNSTTAWQKKLSPTQNWPSKHFARPMNIISIHTSKTPSNEITIIQIHFRHTKRMEKNLWILLFRSQSCVYYLHTIIRPSKWNFVVV